MWRLLWFGSGWDHPDLLMGNHVPTPVGAICGGCGGLIVEGDQGLISAGDPEADVLAHLGPRPFHRECRELPRSREPSLADYGPMTGS